MQGSVLMTLYKTDRSGDKNCKNIIEVDKSVTISMLSKLAKPLNHCIDSSGVKTLS